MKIHLFILIVTKILINLVIKLTILITYYNDINNIVIFIYKLSKQWIIRLFEFLILIIKIDI